MNSWKSAAIVYCICVWCRYNSDSLYSLLLLSRLLSSSALTAIRDFFLPGGQLFSLRLS